MEAKDKLVIDNAILSNFARINRLDLLLKLPYILMTTREVIDEANNGLEKFPKLLKILEMVKDKQLIVDSSRKIESLKLYADLESLGFFGHGEISTMVLAKEIGGIFVTDEKKATNKARQLGIKTLSDKEFRGSVLILNKLEKDKFITKKDFEKIKKELKSENFNI